MRLIIIIVGVCLLFLTAGYLLKKGRLGEPAYSGKDPLDMLGKLPVGERIYESITKDLSPEWKGILYELYPGGGV